MDPRCRTGSRPLSLEQSQKSTVFACLFIARCSPLDQRLLCTEDALDAPRCFSSLRCPGPPLGPAAALRRSCCRTGSRPLSPGRRSGSPPPPVPGPRSRLAAAVPSEAVTCLSLQVTRPHGQDSDTGNVGGRAGLPREQKERITMLVMTLARSGQGQRRP